MVPLLVTGGDRRPGPGHIITTTGRKAELPSGLNEHLEQDLMRGRLFVCSNQFSFLSSVVTDSGGV